MNSSSNNYAGLIRNGNTDLTPENDEALTKYLRPIVREMVKRVVENEQNLIVEGCYIPFDWRQDFDEQYLAHIRFICLAMTAEYIENHFDEIISHESEVETRLVEADCTISGLKADNKNYVDGFQKAGEHVVIINDNYEKTIKALIAWDLVYDWKNYRYRDYWRRWCPSDCSGLLAVEEGDDHHIT